MIFVLFGTIAAMSTGIFLDRTNRYTLALKYSCIGSTLSIASGVFLLNGTIWGGCIFAFLGGFTMTPILPIGFSLATESTHPVQPALVTGFMMSMGQMFLFGLFYFYLYFLPTTPTTENPDQPKLVLLIMAASPALATILAFFVKQDLRRLSSILDVKDMVSKSPKIEYK